MNRFFRTAYSTTLVYLYLVLFGVLITRVKMPFLSFSCLYFALLLCLLPGVSQKLNGKEGLFRVLGAATAMLGFLPIALWRCPLSHWLIHLSGIAAAGVFLSILRHRTTHGIFMEKYRFSVVSLGVLIGFICLAMVTGVYQGGQGLIPPEAMREAVSSAVPYAIILLASGTLLLRGLRAESGKVDDQAFNRRQLRDVLIFAILVTLVFAVDPFVYLRKAVFFLLNDVLRPSARFLAQVLVSILRAVPRREESAAATPLPEETAEPKPMPLYETAETEAESYFVEGNDLALTIAYVFIAAAALFLLIVLASEIRRLFRNLRWRGRNPGSGYPNETREKLPPKDGTRRERKPKKRSGDPREQIRYLYGGFLGYLNKLRVRFDNTDTCGEIRRCAEKRAVADPPTLSGLTVIYEEARYRLAETPDEADVRAMKELLDRIKKKP